MNDYRYNTPSSQAPNESYIDRESHFTGTYRSRQNLRIDGRYDGDIECDAAVVIGDTASVNARVLAGSMTVAGRLEGEVMCENRFEILPTGRVSGTITAGTTVIHEGAFYQGELRMAKPGEIRPAGRERLDERSAQPRERAATPAAAVRPVPSREAAPTPPPTARRRPGDTPSAAPAADAEPPVQLRAVGGNTD